MVISGQGTQFSWGTVSLSLTSISVSASGSETEITSMSSKVLEDNETNPPTYRIVRDYDSGIAPETQVSLEFIGDTQTLNAVKIEEWVGLKKPLVLTLPADEKGEGEGFKIETSAILSQMTLTVAVGDYVRGSASFRLSGL